MSQTLKFGNGTWATKKGSTLAYNDEDGGLGAGQTYLILGKSSGWTMDVNLSTADASYIGEEGNV